ncbi:MAG: PP2C family serine/threonine-protein phosphatase [Legionella sp.]|nr:PP2C family serine/threonine-protein phosphatase [Legionella sp.]
MHGVSSGSTGAKQEEDKVENKEQGFGLYETIGMCDGLSNALLKSRDQEDAACAYWFSQKELELLSAQEIGFRLWSSYRILNAEIKKMGLRRGGATACTTVYDGKDHLITATLADSIAFLVVYHQNNEVPQVIRLNKILHNPSTETELTRLGRKGITPVNGRIKTDRASLAVSRAMGDFSYPGLTANAGIDIVSLSELGIDFKTVKKIQVISACDGFTEGQPDQTKEGHEAWLKVCLLAINDEPDNGELELAEHLAHAAINAGSQDNISVSVHTLIQSQSFLMGIYDGHGGRTIPAYIAQKIGDVFRNQCMLSQEEYEQTPWSVNNHLTAYCSDNPELEEVHAERAGRSEKLEPFLRQMDLFMSSKVTYGNRLFRSKCVYDLIGGLTVLANMYQDADLDEQELASCVTFILEDKSDVLPDLKYNYRLPVDLQELKAGAQDLMRSRTSTTFCMALLAGFMLYGVCMLIENAAQSYKI